MDNSDTIQQRPLSGSLRSRRFDQPLANLNKDEPISIPKEFTDAVDGKNLGLLHAADNQRSIAHAGDTPGDASSRGHADGPITQIKYAIHTSPLHHNHKNKHNDHHEHAIQAPALPTSAAPPLPVQTLSAHYPTHSTERPSDSLVSNIGTASHLDLPPSELTVDKNEPYVDNEDLNEEDKVKAAQWAAGVLDNKQNDFLPELVLKTGFQIKKYRLWMPLDIAVDQQNHRFTFTYADNFLQLWQKKPIAHRVDINEVMREKPQSRKHSYPPEERGDRLHFSKRRMNLIRTDGQGKYHLMAPSKEYRDKLLDAIFLMHHPTSSTSL